ncbi:MULTISPECIES: helix-turn-helix domain-containing protein [Anaerotruncus]|jgi:transcriptional regulator with XRE-family HTH domain|uniref:helix-turn-helix domain-containing protein n=1 Tax=Anaerotruncus TaxID=244127 RepID=UPI0008368DBB|nr:MULTISPECIES: helix-turn-helix transcriptional regulator [Anaerotruncus]RGX56160.1 XRE family transcriptional regulator [Anaerotruncus sp. AF02-27]
MECFERLRALREDSDKTQEDVANYLGIKRQMYRRYETGEVDLPMRHVKNLVLLYQTTADYILGLSDERNPYNGKRK